MSEPMTAEMLDQIVTAYCDANMKCDDDTGLYDVRPGCEARRDAARVWLTVTAVGLLIDEVRRFQVEVAALRAERDAALAEIDAIRTVLECDNHKTTLSAVQCVHTEWRAWGPLLEQSLAELAAERARSAALMEAGDEMAAYIARQDDCTTDDCNAYRALSGWRALTVQSSGGEKTP